MIYAKPGTAGAVVTLKPRYGNYINGEFVAPVGGQYFTNTSPVDASVIGEFPRSDAKDIDKALDAAHDTDAYSSSVQAAKHALLNPDTLPSVRRTHGTGRFLNAKLTLFRKVWLGLPVNIEAIGGDEHKR